MIFDQVVGTLRGEHQDIVTQGVHTESLALQGLLWTDQSEVFILQRIQHLGHAGKCLMKQITIYVSGEKYKQETIVQKTKKNPIEVALLEDTACLVIFAMI